MSVAHQPTTVATRARTSSDHLSVFVLMDMNRLVPVMFVKVFHVGSFVCICPDGYEQIGPSDVCQGIPHPLISLCVVLAVHCSSSAYFCHRFLSLVTVITMDTTVG